MWEKKWIQYPILPLSLRVLLDSCPSAKEIGLSPLCSAVGREMKGLPVGELIPTCASRAAWPSSSDCQMQVMPGAPSVGEELLAHAQSESWLPVPEGHKALLAQGQSAAPTECLSAQLGLCTVLSAGEVKAGL